MSSEVRSIGSQIGNHPKGAALELGGVFWLPKEIETVLHMLKGMNFSIYLEVQLAGFSQLRGFLC